MFGYSKTVPQERSHIRGMFSSLETICQSLRASYPVPLICNQESEGTCPKRYQRQTFRSSALETYPAYSNLPHKPGRRHWLSAWTVCEDNLSADWQSSHEEVQLSCVACRIGCFLFCDATECAVPSPVWSVTSGNDAGTVSSPGLRLTRIQTSRAWNNQGL